MTMAIPARSSGSLALAVCALALAPVLARGQKGGSSQKDVRRELRELYESDQKDQNDPAWTEANEAEFGRRQTERRNRVMEIIEGGLLGGDLEGWGHAAMLLQHGDSADDYLLAHVLAVRCGFVDQAGGRFLSAATLDRFLQTIGRPQIFTTQSNAPDPSTYAPAEPFDDSMGQALRALFTLPPLPGREEQAGKKGKAKADKGPSAKDLPQLMELSKTETVAGQEVPEWLQRTRELAVGGTLRSEKDLDLAARILLASGRADDLLWAHVLAMGAAFKTKNPAARQFCAETLDRFLLALGRKQRFDTVRENGAPKEPREPLPGFIVKEYGLKG